MKKLIVMAMMLASVPAYADVTVVISDKILNKYCEQPQFNTYKPEYNDNVESFDCKEFVAAKLAGEIEQGADFVYAASVAADVEAHKQTLIDAEKAK